MRRRPEDCRSDLHPVFFQGRASRGIIDDTIRILGWKHLGYDRTANCRHIHLFLLETPCNRECMPLPPERTVSLRKMQGTDGELVIHSLSERKDTSVLPVERRIEASIPLVMMNSVVMLSYSVAMT